MVSFLEVLGGLALFLYGVHMMTTGMEKLAGNKIQEWLDRMTDRPIKGAFFGLVATALIRSSGLLMVTMISLVNANLMTLEQAVGVMMGQEIGTTITAQIVAFKVGNLCYLFIAVGFLLIELNPRHRGREWGENILGFGLVFLGMNLMSDALGVLAQMPAVADWLALMGRDLPLGVLAGTVVTAVVQSSSASTSLVVAMGISHTITLPTAVALLLGANIGSCIMGLIASIRLSRASKQASIAQILINVIGVLFFLPFISRYAALVSHTSASLPRQIANAHTIFNLASSIALFPFVKQIARVSKWLVPVRPQKEAVKLTAYIDDGQHTMPPVALAEALRELNRIGETTAQMIESGRLALVEGAAEAAQWVLAQEQELVDPLCSTLTNFLNRLMQESLSIDQQKRCFQLKNLIIDIERVGDIAENLAQAAQKKLAHSVTFSAQASDDLSRLCRHAHGTYISALQALREDDKVLARRVCRLEGEFDGLYHEARQAHIDRMNAGICSPEANVIFIETLRNLERISDHADNLGVSVQRN